MSNFIDDKIGTWEDSEKAMEIYLMLDYLEKRLFRTYEVSLPPNPDFWTRCRQWIANANNKKQLEEKLFKSITHIFYVGPEEFNELYRSAYNDPIAKWLIDNENIAFTDPCAGEKLKESVKKTWFCPISDSMAINKFYHINNIPSCVSDVRPELRALTQFGDESKILDYIDKNKIDYIVLLEDFVGSGSQMSNSIQRISFLVKKVNVKILVVPLIICPKGHNLCKSLSKRLDIEFSPVLPLGDEVFIPKIFPNDAEPHIKDLSDMAHDTYQQVSNNIPPGARKPYGPLGYKNTGGLIVMFTNTPDNTLPMFHWTSQTWDPIFPRHSRN
ncbi:MAG: hypothetical protein OXF42_06785 [Candidatus Dadabacteria bacterium]|nr:hypothetical protein [Candidatus Dadabacteria bacterium]